MIVEGREILKFEILVSKFVSPSSGEVQVKETHSFYRQVDLKTLCARVVIEHGVVIFRIMER